MSWFVHVQTAPGHATHACCTICPYDFVSLLLCWSLCPHVLIGVVCIIFLPITSPYMFIGFSCLFTWFTCVDKPSVVISHVQYSIPSPPKPKPIASHDACWLGWWFPVWGFHMCNHSDCLNMFTHSFYTGFLLFYDVKRYHNAAQVIAEYMRQHNWVLAGRSLRAVLMMFTVLSYCFLFCFVFSYRLLNSLLI